MAPTPIAAGILLHGGITSDTDREGRELYVFTSIHNWAISDPELQATRHAHLRRRSRTERYVTFLPSSSSRDQITGIAGYQ